MNVTRHTVIALHQRNGNLNARASDLANMWAFVFATSIMSIYSSNTHNTHDAACGWKNVSRLLCTAPQVLGGANVVTSTPLQRNFSLMSTHNSLSNTAHIIGKSSFV